MPYHIVSTNVVSYVRIAVDGIRQSGEEKSDAITLIREVVEICRAEKLDKVLLVWNVKGKLPPLAAYEIASRAEKHFDLDFQLKMAAVHRDEESFQSNLFTEIVAQNHGYSFRVFDNEVDAQKWLI